MNTTQHAKEIKGRVPGFNVLHSTKLIVFGYIALPHSVKLDI